jgi:hypothetical protein
MGLLYLNDLRDELRAGIISSWRTRAEEGERHFQRLILAEKRGKQIVIGDYYENIDCEVDD